MQMSAKKVMNIQKSDLNNLSLSRKTGPTFLPSCGFDAIATKQKKRGNNGGRIEWIGFLGTISAH